MESSPPRDRPAAHERWHCAGPVITFAAEKRHKRMEDLTPPVSLAAETEVCAQRATDDLGELPLPGCPVALGKVLAGDLPRPGFPPKLRQTAPAAWSRLAAGALHFAAVHAGRQDQVACLANLCQAVLAAAQGRLAAAGEWVLNEKRLTERAGLGSVQDQLRRPEQDLGTLVSGVRACLDLRDDVWTGE